VPAKNHPPPLPKIIAHPATTPDLWSTKKQKNSTTMSFEPNLTIGECVVSYFLMMAVILAGGFIGQWWIAGFGLLFFLRGVTGFCAVKAMMSAQKA
jgi:hypothetical protein